MAQKKNTEKMTKSVDAGRKERPKEVVDPEVSNEFTEAQRLGGSGASRLARDLREHHSRTPELTGGDIDADWESAGDVGEEAVGGDNPTPDQDVVEEIGGAMGLVYNDDEPLHTTEKLEQRDRRRWEFNPASSEDFEERVHPDDDDDE